MAIMDPLLNFGILWRCLAAYCGVNFQIESENYRQLLNLDAATASTTTNGGLANGSAKKASSSQQRLNRSSSATVAKINSVDSSSEITSTPIPEETTTTPSFKCDSDDTDAASSPTTGATTEAERERLVKLYEVMGDSIFLIEKLRGHPILYDPFISPLLSDDSVLAKFPRTCLIVSSISLYKHVFLTAALILTTAFNPLLINPSFIEEWLTDRYA